MGHDLYVPRIFVFVALLLRRYFILRFHFLFCVFRFIWLFYSLSRSVAKRIVIYVFLVFIASRFASDHFIECFIASPARGEVFLCSSHIQSFSRTIKRKDRTYKKRNLSVS